MKIRINQIEDLSSLISNVSTGESFTSALSNYFENSGFSGPTVFYLTGNQFAFGQKSFNSEPFVPTGGLNPSGTASKEYVNSWVSGNLLSYSGWASGEYVSKTLSEIVGGTKTFTSNVFVPLATLTGHATNFENLLKVSGVLQSGLDNVTIDDAVLLGTSQVITGQKTFNVSPLVVTPTDPSGAVPLSMLTGIGASNAILLTGAQTASGVKTFVNSPIVPVAISSNQAINKAQLDAGLANVAVGTGSIQGVTNVNGLSGAVLIDGINGISVITCSGILYVSGNAQNTNLYSVSLPLTSGITGINFSYATGFAIEPNVVGTLKYAGQGNLQFVDDVILNSNSGGFSVAFSTGIPSTGYYYNFSAIPVSGGSGFLGIKGDRGYPATNLRQRGQFQIGLLYQPYDTVFTAPNFVSYWTTGTAISDSSNAPSGTGNSLWQILASGRQGPSGYYIHRGNFDTGIIYTQKDSAVYDGSTYVYTGSNPVSGFTPDALTGGWGLVAAKAPLGYYINSGVVTGNFTNLSFYISPITTGLDLAESFIARSFFFTGFAVGCISSGTAPLNGGIFTGRIYVRDTGNNKIILNQFTFDTGKFFFRSGDFSQPITGDYRVGIDIRNTLSGMDKLSIGIYGFGT